MSAAVRLVAAEGLGVATAAIAKEAGVSNGSIFTYFETKADLLNRLYVELKVGMAEAALRGLPPGAELRDQFFRIWSRWMGWGAANPEKRRALAHLGVSEEITPESRAAGHKSMEGIAEVLERCRSSGPLRDTPMAFVVAIMNSLAEATMDFITRDPANADKHCKVGFDALWRVLG